MKARTLASVAILALLASSSSATSLYVDSSVAVEFASFKAKYGKTYGSVAEELRRMRVFEDNLQMAMLAQAANPQATFGVTKFSDLTREEFQAMYANGAAHYAARKRNLKKRRAAVKRTTKEVPEALDWRNAGAVTPVKDQGQCGSCWAFSTIGNIEGQWFLAGNELVNLSEQQLVSCDDSDGGCQGGVMEEAFDWLIESHNGTVFTGESYPYVSGDEDVPECTEEGHVVGATITDYAFSQEGGEEAMQEWLVSQGPLSIAVDSKMFQFYKSGVMTNCVSLWLDHGVVLVGYDNTASTPYWIVKNSWGTGWGEDGYIRIRKGTNECLISEYALSAIAPLL